MAYQSRDLSVLAYANGFTLWCYNPDNGDGIEAIRAAYYFDAAADMLRVGDIVLVSLTGGEKVAADMLHVCGNESGVVDVETMSPHGLMAFGSLRPLDNGGAKVER